MLYNIDDFLDYEEWDTSLLTVYNSFHLNDRLPDNSDTDKFEIAYFNADCEDNFQELIPLATDLFEVLLEGHTVFNTFDVGGQPRTLTKKEEKLKRKLLRRMPDGYTENLLGEYYKAFLKVYNLPCDRVFADKLDIASITNGADMKLIKTYFSLLHNLDYVFPELYGYKDFNLLLDFKNKEEMLKFMDFVKPDIFISFVNWHTVFQVQFKKDKYSKKELLEKVLTICDKHGKKLAKADDFEV